ncbi:MAG: type I secretion system permease/ATPase [Halocynthiibacter sp.]
MTHFAPIAFTDTSCKSALFEDAIIKLTQHLGCPLSQADLHTVFHGQESKFDLKAAAKALEYNGFNVTISTDPIEKIDPVLFPLIGLTHDETPYLIFEKHADGHLRVQEFGVKQSEKNLSPAEADIFWQGVFIHLTPPSTEIPDNNLDQNPPAAHWFWSAFSGQRWTYSQIILAAVLSNILGLSTSIFTMVVYDRVIPNDAINSLIALTLGVGIALIFDLIIKTIRANFIDFAGKVADEKLAQRIFNHILALAPNARRGSSGDISNTVREFESLRDFFTSATLTALVDLPFIFLFIAVIWLIGGPLALIPLLAVPIVFLFGLTIQFKLAPLSDSNSKTARSKQGILIETLTGLATIKAVGAVALMRRRWQKAVGFHATQANKSRAITQFALNITALIQQTAQVAIIFYGVLLIQDGRTSMGALIACVILTGRTLAPLAHIAHLLTRLSQARSAYKEINTLMHTPIERSHGDQRISKSNIKGSIALKNVSFRHENALDPILNNINLSLKAGEKVAIMGPLGSGKSTLAHLMLGLQRPDTGKVLIDGTDLRTINPDDLRENIGFALQDIWLFSGSIKENIGLGKHTVTEDDIFEKAQIAGADSFVRHHPHRYDWRIKERGEGLSGGQRQCISLARALIGDPRILVLDEPSSNMDIKTEEKIIQNLIPEVADRTLIIVSHRPNLLKLVDRVIVLGNASIVFDGPKEAIFPTQEK